MQLSLLFTRDELHYQIQKNKRVLEEEMFYTNEDTHTDYLEKQLEKVLTNTKIKEIKVVSALNHFSMVPLGVGDEVLGFPLIALNSNANTDSEELMLAVYKKLGVQFFYSFPKNYYQLIKQKQITTNFTYSGEQFLKNIHPKGGKEIHINLYHQQCEFVALENKKIVLYNNLDVNSEVDFLYFVMFTLSKIGFGIQDTQFMIYGEVKENDTFLSELQKFVQKLKIIDTNQSGHHFMLF